MGVDTIIRLPGNVRVNEVAEVIGVMLGGISKKNYLYTPEGSYYAKVTGVEVRSSSVVGLAEIQIDTKSKACIVLYHFEGEGGTRLLMPRSYPIWIAVGKALVDFFGGSVDYQDCDSGGPDYGRTAKPDSENCPENGPEWQNLQDRLLALGPLTKQDIGACRKYAAYKDLH